MQLDCGMAGQPSEPKRNEAVLHAKMGAKQGGGIAVVGFKRSPNLVPKVEWNSGGDCALPVFTTGPPSQSRMKSQEVPNQRLKCGQTVGRKVLQKPRAGGTLHVQSNPKLTPTAWKSPLQRVGKSALHADPASKHFHFTCPMWQRMNAGKWNHFAPPKP